MGKQLMIENLYQIERWLKEKKTIKEIAVLLEKHENTIRKELQRGTIELLDSNTWLMKKVYCADVSHRKRQAARKKQGRKPKLSRDTIKEIEKIIIDEKYSPDAVIMRLSKVGQKPCCTKTIYNSYKRGQLKQLRPCHFAYDKKPNKSKNMARRPSLKNIGAKMITERPKEVEDRKEYGHWEMDTVLGGRGKGKECLLSLIERKEREQIIVKLKDRKQESVIHAINDMERELGKEAFRKKFKTITMDNGVEFLDWRRLELSTDGTKRTKTFFCHAFASSERGTNENNHRLIRRWIPKGADISKYSDDEIKRIEDWCNNYPRRLHGGFSSKEYGLQNAA
ncbi:MAG: IS30 family transposase [Lachnospiraceae bacterium]|jgi:IS30 family transposase|nr:IS30 family transposase [Lachnospiraceae bacterium]